jgi:hypothetical protein
MEGYAVIIKTADKNNLIIKICIKVNLKKKIKIKEIKNMHLCLFCEKLERDF